MKTGKVWGEARMLHRAAGVKVSEATLLPSSHCSWHHHATHWNGFYCVEGELVVEAQKAAMVDRTILRAGEFTAIPPGEKHRFLTGDLGAVVVEFYWQDPDRDDIVRTTDGGSDFGRVGLPDEPGEWRSLMNPVTKRFVVMEEAAEAPDAAFSIERAAEAAGRYRKPRRPAKRKR